MIYIYHINEAQIHKNLHITIQEYNKNYVSIE